MAKLELDPDRFTVQADRDAAHIWLTCDVTDDCNYDTAVHTVREGATWWPSLGTLIREASAHMIRAHRPTDPPQPRRNRCQMCEDAPLPCALCEEASRG